MDSNDQNIIETNSDATNSKYSCVVAGYYEDAYLKYFAQSPTRRNPIINLGYAIRTSVIRNVVENFCLSYPGGQIVSIGSGSDTLPFWALGRFSDIKVIELDHDSVLLSKLRCMKKNASAFSSILDPSSFPDLHALAVRGSKFTWSSVDTRLSMIGLDLRSDPSIIIKRLEEGGFDYSRPTLFLSECVLIYLEREVSNRVLRALRSMRRGEPVFLALYEQVNQADGFGKVMMENLHLRGCPLLSILPSTEAQRERLEALGFADVRIERMTFFTNRIKTKRPEIIDEFEEFNLLQDHYFFALACSSPMADDFLTSVFPNSLAQ